MKVSLYKLVACVGKYSLNCGSKLMFLPFFRTKIVFFLENQLFESENFAHFDLQANVQSLFYIFGICHNILIKGIALYLSPNYLTGQILPKYPTEQIHAVAVAAAYKTRKCKYESKQQFCLIWPHTLFYSTH